MDEYITRNNAISAACFGCNQQFSDKPCEPSECTIRQSIMALSTADVAPKSEVEKIFEKLKRRECSNSVCAWCIHANAYGRRNEECDKPYIDKNGKEQKACYSYAKFESLIDNELAELKKKYTGEQT